MVSVDEDQIWFLTIESVSATEYKLGQISLKDVEEHGISFGCILRKLDQPGRPEDFSFWIHANSMYAAVQMLTDEAIFATWKLYCTDQPAVSIIVRPKDDPSPNTSNTPSHQSSLKERRRTSGLRTIPEIRIRPPAAPVLRGQDIVMMEDIAEMPIEELVTITLADGERRTFNKEYMLELIRSRFSSARPLTEIELQTFANGELVKTKLTREIWEGSLVRGPWKDSFLEIWTLYLRTASFRATQLAKLRKKYPNFNQNCIQFIQDLHTYERQGSQTRLAQTGHEFFLGPPYFEGKMVQQILELRTMSGTINDELQTLKTRVSSTDICASHDLSPIFEAAFGISWTGKPVMNPVPISSQEISGEGTVKNFFRRGWNIFGKKRN
ncbi:hypothetical protein N7495_002866 [Penicillium taxi]|uniref:uncharacterized protein n=1 Tax=Penicillium taxi TaxID=168475 RepID=UPI00254586A8|nr:uncharacterized protein N7495_002866 [Penicillium taxi]KAJ5902338.1 hypothetical protein N7495_002866 [Penicillium taxi]